MGVPGFFSKSTSTAGLAALLVLTVGSARGTINTLAPDPAATLLLPYFEVDLNDRTRTTLFSLGNLSADPVVAHVVFWTNASVPTLAFDIYLTGYDVECVDLATIFHDGQFPQTDQLSNQGSFSTSNVAFPGCTLPPSALTAPALVDLKAAHTGQPVPAFGNQCGGVDLGDQVARGYLTIDNVNNCNIAFPSQAGYFVDGGTGTANNKNSLWGDWFLLHEASNFQQADTLVHIEADASLGMIVNSSVPPDSGGSTPTGPGVPKYTFYGRYVNGTGIDNREPLATTWMVGFREFLTDLIVWRDSGTASAPFACTGPPDYGRLGQTQIGVFDHAENLEQVTALNVFPDEVNRVVVGSSSLPITPKRGWIFLNLNTAVTGAFFNPGKQAFVTAIQFPHPTILSVGSAGVQLDNASDLAPGNGGTTVSDIGEASPEILDFLKRDWNPHKSTLGKSRRSTE